jgi:uncharacterized protein YkwD
MGLGKFACIETANRASTRRNGAYIRIALVMGVFLVVLVAGCDGGEAGQTELTGAGSPGEGMSATQDEGGKESHDPTSSGGRVETCGGGSIYLNAKEKRYLELHNEAREQRGLESLCLQPTLTKAARSHSKDMIENDYFAHSTPGGESLGERLKRFGYVPEKNSGFTFWRVGGNIAWSSNADVEPSKIFEGWMNSSSHRHNILEEDFRQVGVGTHTGEYTRHESSIMITTDFGVRRW